MVFRKQGAPQPAPVESPKELKVEEVWEVMQVPATFELAVVNESTKEVLTQIQATARILNNIELLMKEMLQN